MAAPTKVGHVGKQSTRLDGGLKSSERFPWRHKSVKNDTYSALSTRQAAMMKTERLGLHYALDRVVQSIVGQ